MLTTTQYRVTFNGGYLFHVRAISLEDALKEAQTLVRRTMRPAVEAGLVVTLEA